MFDAELGEGAAMFDAQLGERVAMCEGELYTWVGYKEQLATERLTFAYSNE